MRVAGMGFRASASLETMRRVLHLACGGQMPDLIATAKGKETSAALRALADELRVPLRAVAHDRLAHQTTLTCSQVSNATYGTGSVAEAAALAAAGAGARLVAPRHISIDRMATCAIAEGTST